MADYSKNITNSVRVFGNNPSTKWGQTSAPTMIWGASKWGEGTIPMGFTTVHYVTNTQVVDSSRPTADLTKIFAIGSVSATGNMSMEHLQNGIWDVVFVSDTTNVIDRDFASWTQGSSGTVSYTCGSAGSTTWS